MTSKYNGLRAFMDGNEKWNDKGKNGRILKWYADTTGATLEERKAVAAQIFEQLSLLGSFVQKVVVRNAKTSTVHYVGAGKGTDGGDYLVSKYADYDKIAVYIDTI